MVTAATVGYGDLFPETTAGHLVGAYVIVGGIVSLTTVFTRLAGAIDNARSRRMKGTSTLDHRDHLVVLGYSARTHRADRGRASSPTATARWCCAPGTRWRAIRCPTTRGRLRPR